MQMWVRTHYTRMILTALTDTHTHALNSCIHTLGERMLGEESARERDRDQVELVIVIRIILPQNASLASSSHCWYHNVQKIALHSFTGVIEM